MTVKDLIVIGGGINGTGIGVDAAGRGLSVLLLEADDLAGATSSASSKLIHGGLRYLEHYEFRLVREALAEREVLLNMVPHLAFPIRFHLPHESHLRPAWMLRIGLFLYDHLSSLNRLEKSKKIHFRGNSPLKETLTNGFAYSDCWVDDARLVLVNALELVRQGGEVRTRTTVTQAYRENGLWVIKAQDNLTGEEQIYTSKGLVNATGPWVKPFYEHVLRQVSPHVVHLIKGSHIVIPKLYQGTEAYILQNSDQRIVFVIPWLQEFLIVGTTDIEFQGDLRQVVISEQETTYLLNIYNHYFKHQLKKQDIVWSYAGVRPLCSDESNSPHALTRDYTLEVEDHQGTAPLLSVFGGKLTTYRKLAEHAMEKLARYYPYMGNAWTAHALLPGGEMGMSCQQYSLFLQRNYPWLPMTLAIRYAHTYGARSRILLGDSQCLEQLGTHFGHSLYEAEVYYLLEYEWVQTVDDILWRRTKLGMWFNSEQRRQLSDWLGKNHGLPRVKGQKKAQTNAK